VEKNWSYDSPILLKPPPPGDERLMTKILQNETFLMADYDNFNDFHSIRTMKLVFELLALWFQPGELDWCIASFDDMSVNIGGKETTWLATLPSGHRATSFINSIMNYAYIKAECGDLVNKVNLFCCGDDVFAGGPVDTVDNIFALLMSSTLRLNVHKQSLGKVSAEFLRVSIGRNSAAGYLARAIATLTAGNWTNERELSIDQYVTSIRQGIWNVCNRSRDKEAGMLMLSTIRRRLPWLVDPVGFCTLRVAINNSPVMHNRSTTIKADVEYSYSKGNTGLGVERAIKRKHTKATDEYMRNYVPVEVFESCGIKPAWIRTVMLEASYQGGERKQQAKVRQVNEVAIIDIIRSSRHYRDPDSGEFGLLLRRLRSKVPDNKMYELCLKLGMSVKQASAVIGEACSEPSAGELGVPYQLIAQASRGCSRPSRFISKYFVYA